MGKKTDDIIFEGGAIEEQKYVSLDGSAASIIQFVNGILHHLLKIDVIQLVNGTWDIVSYSSSGLAGTIDINLDDNQILIGNGSPIDLHYIDVYVDNDGAEQLIKFVTKSGELVEQPVFESKETQTLFPLNKVIAGLPMKKGLLI